MQGGSSTNTQFRAGALLVPGLIGVALSWFALSTVQRFGALLLPSFTLAHITVLAVLCCLALGIWLPSYFAKEFHRLTLRYRRPATRRDRLASYNDLEEEVITDAQLRVLGAACLVLSGLAIMAISPLPSKLGAFHAYAMDAFHWTRATHRALELVLVAGYAVVPLVLLGIALNCVQRVGLLHSRRPLLTLTCLCAGLCVGLVLWPAAEGLSSAVTTSISALVLLVTGLAQLQPARRGDLCSGESADLPVVCDRWRFVLIWILVAGGFLTTSYISLGQRFASITAGWPDVALLLVALSVGMIMSNFSFSRWFQSLPGIAILCMWTSGSITAAVCMFGSVGATNEPAAAGFGLSLLEKGVISLPAIVMGLVLAMTTAAVVDRSARPSTGSLSSSLSICLGAALACAAVILKLGAGFSVFQVLVLNTLVWLVLGGLLLIYEPQFGLKNRWIHASLMFAMLLAFVIVLPLQAPAWSIIREHVRAASTGSLHTAISHIDADRAISAASGPRPVAPTAPLRLRWAVEDRRPRTAAELIPVYTMLEKLQISKERYASIIITLPSAPSRYFSKELQTALIQTAGHKLRRDGVFVTQFPDSPADHDAMFEHWRRQTDMIFGSTEVITESGVGGPVAQETRYLVAGGEPRRQAQALLRREQPLAGP